MNVIPHILFTSLFSIIVLFLLAKLMGNRQVSQMSMFDYVNGITIGSIAAEFATSLEDDYWMPLTAMVVWRHRRSDLLYYLQIHGGAQIHQRQARCPV